MGTNHRRRIAAAVVAGGLLGAGVLSAEDGEGPVSLARAALQKWVEVEKLITRERAEWAEGKEILEDRIDLVQTSIDDLRAGRDEVEAKIAENEGRRRELQAKDDALAASFEGLAAKVRAVEERTLALVERLPPILQAKVKPFTQQIPEDPENTTLTLGRRFAFLAAILNEANKFQREISTRPEILTLSDGTEAEVECLYVGLGLACYASEDGTAAGTGSAGPEGWEWRPMDAAAAEIAKAIGILNAGKTAEYVDLPVQIDQKGGRR